MTNSPIASEARLPIRLMSVSMLAQRLGVTVRTLHFYEDQGLIHPRRTEHNARVYDPKTVALVETIVFLREMGLSVAAIRDIQLVQSDPKAHAAAMRAALAQVLADKQLQIATIQRRLEMLAEPIAASAPSQATTSSGSPPFDASVLLAKAKVE